MRELWVEEEGSAQPGEGYLHTNRDRAANRDRLGKIKEEGLVESREQNMRHSVERRVPDPAKELNWGVSELQGTIRAK